MKYSILYKSKAISTFQLADIQTMLNKSKRFNKANDITGLIIYYDAQFLQLIEGEEDQIKTLYDLILNDERHSDVETILSQPTNDTLWNKWSMAFYHFSDSEVDNNHLRLLLESNFTKVESDNKDSEILKVLRKEAARLLNS